MQTLQAILRLNALRNIELQQGGATPPLMERAGQAAAALALQLLGASTKPPLIIAGPGNNGGDAFVVARVLHSKGLKPAVVFCGNAEKLPPDARAAHDAWLACGGTVLDDAMPHAGEYGLVIDGLFGIGLTRPPEGRHAQLIERINSLKNLVLALDIPSGLDSETGRALGVAVHATHTATFIALKPGLLTLDGPDHCGIVSVHDLALNTVDAEAYCVAPELFIERLKPRRKNSHKGSYGCAGILGGAAGMTGAALLAGRAAIKLGAGRVYVGLLASASSAGERLFLDPQQPELMLRGTEEIFPLATCLAIGPGLGQSGAALALLRMAIDQSLPLLLDADALNLLASHPVLAGKLGSRSAATILTPHPTEAARLLGIDTDAIQADRVAAALTLAQRFRAAVLLKGCGSIIALPDGRWFINTSGNPGLASAGTGDVLCGMIIALLAQNWPAELALLASVHLHGSAADASVDAGIGPVGLTASELITAARQLLNQWIANSHLHAR